MPAAGSAGTPVPFIQCVMLPTGEGGVEALHFFSLCSLGGLMQLPTSGPSKMSR